jgi:hypothetical protein
MRAATRVLNYETEYATLDRSTPMEQTNVLRDYLVARRRALLLESRHIEQAIAQIDAKQTVKVTR